jgi:hypothetical protein
MYPNVCPCKNFESDSFKWNLKLMPIQQPGGMYYMFQKYQYYKKIFMYEVIFVYVLFSTFSYCQAHNCEFLWPHIHIFRKLTSLILF